jgi:hypothetical protein
MDSNRRPEGEEEDDEPVDAPTSVTHVPEALLQALRNPERAAPTVRPPPPAPAPPAEPEGDEDQSQTLVAAGANKKRMVPRPKPPEQAPKSGTKPTNPIARFTEETEDSPDEDPSDTMMGGEIPEQVIRHLSQSPRAGSIPDVAIPPPPRGPMFEPPPAEMFDPPPPGPADPVVTTAALMARQQTAPSGRRVTQRRIMLALAVALLVFAATAASYILWFRARG